MKKIISVLLIAVFMLSFVSLNTGLIAFAEDGADEVSVVDDSTVNTSADSSDEASKDIVEKEDGSFTMTIESLKIMGFGMLGIFIVTGILVCVMYLLSLIKDKQK